MQSIKATAEKTSNRAGATPLCAAFSRPKFRGIAPALLRSLREAVLAACTDQNIHFVMQAALQSSTEKEEVLSHF